MTGVADGLTPLGRLGQYMNFWRIHDEPPVLVTMDHRAVLVAAWAARRQGLFGAAMPLLVRFDAHLDLGERPRPWAWEAAQLTDLDAVHAMVNDQRLDDGGWVNAAMQFGLAGDVATLGVHDEQRLPTDNDACTDHLGRAHELATFPTLGALREAAGRSRRVASLWERINEGAATEPLWLDFDLDFATRRLDDTRVRPWTAGEWQVAFPEQDVGLLARLIGRARLVTIATEPEFCGGHGAVGVIAGDLRALLEPHGPWLERL
jgi:hypothetical protein